MFDMRQGKLEQTAVVYSYQLQDKRRFKPCRDDSDVLRSSAVSNGDCKMFQPALMVSAMGQAVSLVRVRMIGWKQG